LFAPADGGQRRAEEIDLHDALDVDHGFGREPAPQFVAGVTCENKFRPGAVAATERDVQALGMRRQHRSHHGAAADQPAIVEPQPRGPLPAAKVAVRREQLRLAELHRLRGGAAADAAADRRRKPADEP
jgi:hypothetical protein